MLNSKSQARTKAKQRTKADATTSSHNDAKPNVMRRAVKLKPIEKVAQALKGNIDSFSDGSQSWVLIEDKEWTINICFNAKGDEFEHITVAKKIYQVVDEKLIARIGVGS